MTVYEQTATVAINAQSQSYLRRIHAWAMYDWANSGFVVTVSTVILPVYFSRVAAATLPSEATATAYWSLSLSISLLISAILSPILGTISDVTRSKKRLLAFFAGQGIMATALLVLVEHGNWLLALLAFVAARVGWGSANVFYDALLPHVAREEDRDRVSARGYAMGYLGGGLLLAVNIAMLQFMQGTWGARASFLSVAVWWALFSIPVLSQVPEPRGDQQLHRSQTSVTATLKHLAGRLSDIRRYRELFKYLIAFLIYNDGIGTIVGLGVIYGAELGFSQMELVLALLMLQFVSLPFSLIFGRLPNENDTRRALYLSLIIFNLVALPVAAYLGMQWLPATITGAAPSGLGAGRESQLGIIFGLLLVIQLVGVLFSVLLGARIFARLAARMDQQRSILLSLAVFAALAIWGFVLESVLEFWFMAWLLAVVLGGSQALSRSLYANLSPASKSGEFFGLFSVMEKFSSMIGPLMFAGAFVLFGSSRPGILSLIVLFGVGAFLLARVNVEEGRRVASEEDAAARMHMDLVDL